MAAISIEIENEERFRAALQRAKDAVGDLRVPLTGIARRWFKAEKAIFSLKGPGQYKDLTTLYKRRKAQKTGSAYPILKFSGRLETSITNPNSTESINRIINSDTLEVGTKVPYSSFLQFGTRRMPSRPFLLLGAATTQYAQKETQDLTQAWLNILNDYVLQKLEIGENA